MNQTPAFVILYRWRLHPEREASFVEAWSQLSAWYRERHGSLGSRLHRGSDGLWYSYAMWPSAAARERAFASAPALAPEVVRRMRQAVLEELPEVILEPVADFFKGD